MSGDVRHPLARFTFHASGVIALLALVGVFASTVQRGFGCCSESTEWPPGIATGVARASTGEVVVLVAAADRVQLYDGDGRFLHGWNVGEFGRLGGLHLSAGDVINVYAAGRRIRYDLEGQVLESAPAGEAPAPPPTLYRWVPGSSWYWFLLSPVPCILVLFLALGVRGVTDPDKPRRRRGRRQGGGG